jgi:hypothetical protein
MPNAEPPSKPSPAEPSKPKGCMGVLMALGLAALVFVGLFMLSGGAVAPAAVIAGIIFGVAAFHYIVWGWWLSGMIRQQVEDEERTP